MRFKISLLLALVLLTGSSSRAQAPGVDARQFQRITIGAATTAAPEVRVAVETLVTSGFVKGPLFEALKPFFGQGGAAAGAVDPQPPAAQPAQSRTRAPQARAPRTRQAPPVRQTRTPARVPVRPAARLVNKARGPRRR